MECPVCWSKCEDRGVTDKGIAFDCIRCGRFLLSDTCRSVLPAMHDQHSHLASVLSNFIRLQQGKGVPPTITTYLADRFVAGELCPPTPLELRDRLIVWIGDHQRSLVERARATRSEVAASIGAYKMKGRGEAEDGFQWLLQQLQSEEFFLLNETSSEIQAELRMSGWALYQQLKLGEENSRTAFMAMKFGERELNEIVDAHFRPAVEQAGFVLRVLTDGQPAGHIDNQIRARIRSAAFVVADLSHDNDGAYFEAGFAEGLGLPVIYTCEAEKFQAKKTHFDTNHLVTIPWDRTNPALAATQLKQTIRNTLPLKAKMTD